MSRRSAARACLFGLAVLAMTFGVGRPMLSLLAVEGSGQEFIRCAPEDRIAAIAARHGLTIVRPLDDHMRGVFLVRGPVPRQQTNAILGDTLDGLTQQLIQQVRSDVDVEHFDINGSATITEV